MVFHLFSCIGICGLERPPCFAIVGMLLHNKPKQTFLPHYTKWQENDAHCTNQGTNTLRNQTTESTPTAKHETRRNDSQITSTWCTNIKAPHLAHTDFNGTSLASTTRRSHTRTTLTPRVRCSCLFLCCRVNLFFFFCVPSSSRVFLL